MTTHESAPTLDLGHASTPGLAIPQIGFGVWEVPDRAVDAAFGQALDDGYRHIDTARIYGNEEGVGRVLAREDVDRDSVFVTTKVWNDDHTDVPAGAGRRGGRGRAPRAAPGPPRARPPAPPGARPRLPRRRGPRVTVVRFE